MIDCAKVADLVLLLIDASFGFEMVRQRARRCQGRVHTLTVTVVASWFRPIHAE